MKPLRVTGISVLCIALSACGATTRNVDVKPRQEPVYNFTQSSAVLSCLGQRIENSSTAPPVDIYISDIPDHTIPTIESGFLTKNAVMMVTTAVDRLQTGKAQVVGRGGGLPGRRQVQVLGAFTELNRTTESNALSGQAILPGGFEVEVGLDDNFNHIALDLAMSEFNRIIPGTATSVSIQVQGKSGDATLTYDEGDDFAAIAALGFTGQEGFHAAERLLIETSVALMMSRYFDVDLKSRLQSNRREKQVDINSSFDTPVYPSTAPAPSSHTPSPPPAASALPAGPVTAIPAPPAPAPAMTPTYMDMGAAPPALPEENGVVVLPEGSKTRYLTAQPPEYAQPASVQPYSGVPAPAAPDPAAKTQPDYMEQQGGDTPKTLQWGKFKPQ